MFYNKHHHFVIDDLLIYKNGMHFLTGVHTVVLLRGGRGILPFIDFLVVSIIYDWNSKQATSSYFHFNKLLNSIDDNPM